MHTNSFPDVSLQHLTLKPYFQNYLPYRISQIKPDFIDIKYNFQDKVRRNDYISCQSQSLSMEK